MEKPIKTYTSVAEMSKDLTAERKKHPVRLWCYRKFWRLIRFPSGIKLAIKTFIQRGKRGWATGDTWDFDCYLAKVVSEGLIHLRKMQHGHPCDLTIKEWKHMLKEMIWTFETANKIANGDFIYIPTAQWTLTAYNRLKTDTSWKVLSKSQSQRFEKGFGLFKKYFFSLWD